MNNCLKKYLQMVSILCVFMMLGQMVGTTWYRYTQPWPSMGAKILKFFLKNIVKVETHKYASSPFSWKIPTVQKFVIITRELQNWILLL